ncbi:MAG TPA: hypothetical protein VI197_18265 [Polyangiaceae bacterium]
MSPLDDVERELFEQARGEAPAPELRARILGRSDVKHFQRRTPFRGRSAAFAGIGLAAAAALALVLSEPQVPSSDLMPRAEPAAAVPRPVNPRAPSPPAPVMIKPTPAKVEAPRAVAKPARPKQRSLTEQLDLLRRARAALRAGDARQALGVLDEYAAGTNSVDMSAEATLLRIEAMQALGQREQAKHLAESFVARSPDNPLVDRARSLTSGRTEEAVGMGRESDNDEKQKGTTD